MRPVTIAGLFVALTHAGPAIAQADPGRNGFSGFHAGPEAGLVEHHFYIAETGPGGSQATGRYYRAWAPGAGLFVGYDVPVGGRVVIGAEASLSVGGGAPEARFADGRSYVADPRYGYKVTGRAGWRFGEDTLLYGTLGYGGHHYRVEAVGVGNAEPSGHSFTIGAGVEHRLSRTIGVRLDFKHLDNQMSQLLVGLPVRF
ncbi:MAG: outer membrane protein [Allosphingosinicella sp.]